MGNFIKQKLKTLLKRGNNNKKDELRMKYLQFREEPIDEKAVFLEARNGKEINGNIYYLLREMLQDCQYDGMHFIVSSEADKLELIQDKITGMAEDVSRVEIAVVESEEYYRAAATSKYIFCDATLKNFFIKRDEQIYLNVWHGTPFKVMGRKVIHEPHAVGNAQKNFTIADYLLYPNKYMMGHMVEDYMIANTSDALILLGGYPRNTAFFNDSLRDEIREAQNLAEKRVYVYMPTHRPELMGETLAGVLNEMDAEMTDGEVMFAKIHPLASDSVDYSKFKNIRPFPDQYETYEFLNIADVLITDYSSVFYDFAVTGRKIVLYTYDEEDYLSTRGLYEPITSLPFDQVKTIKDVMACSRAPKTYDDRAFVEKYCSYDNPKASKALCERVVFGRKSEELEEVEMPANGKKNVMVYVDDLAPGTATDKLLKMLEGADKSKANYFVTFKRKNVEGHKEMIFRLPEGVDYFGRAGKAYDTGDKTKSDALEVKRCFGNMRIDEVKKYKNNG